MREDFHPITVEWFEKQFGEPTEPQRKGWPEIARRRNTLIAAPTGSGKTLAAFLYSLDDLLKQALANELHPRTQVVYVSPLKALSNDVDKNLQQPLAGLREAAQAAGLDVSAVRTGLRTGDTDPKTRQAMVRKPPHILVTTPESLYLLLTADRGREMIRAVKTVIVDEIHALARDKRGSHLCLSLERLAALCDSPPVRIGLSATQRPMDEIARFLVGTKCVDADGRPDCSIVDVGHVRRLDLSVAVPPTELGAVCTKEHWDELHRLLRSLIEAHRSTLIFVNTRRLAERVSRQLTELLGEDAVASHHGSLSRDIRLEAEEKLKRGELKAIVATASLELGIDVGYIDLVCQVGSPRSIATLLQRVGRSGHCLGATPKGRLLPLTRDDLIEGLALVRAVKQGRLDQVEIPVAPVDVLAQQMIAAAACEEWDEDALYDLCTGAWPYHGLSKGQYEAVLSMLSGEEAVRFRLAGRLHRDVVNKKVRANRGARILASTSGGAIPEQADYRVVTEGDNTFVGTVNEDFAIESLTGDIFLLGNTSWRIRRVKLGEVVVQDAQSAPATIPFWLGEAPGRTVELSKEVSDLRERIADLIEESPHQSENLAAAVERLADECSADEQVAEQAARYVAAQKAAFGMVPTQRNVVFERFFDEAGGMQLVIHSPYGARINRAWGLALRKRFCRSFNFELQASADDNGVVLSLGPQHSFPIDQLFSMLSERNAKDILVQALLDSPMFQVRWRWNATRSLAVPRSRGGKKIPPQLQRMRADDLLSAVFPMSTACLENVTGDIEVPDHPLVVQTIEDCLREAMDVDRWLELIRSERAGEIDFIAKDTREPSPFSHELLNANPYAFLDDAPLEERRARAVATRRTLSTDDFRDLAKLDPLAIEAVRKQAWPTVRDSDELHEALLLMVAVPETVAEGWKSWFSELTAQGRAAVLRTDANIGLWFAVENWPALRVLYPNGSCERKFSLPEKLDRKVEPAEAAVSLVRGYLECRGPVSTRRILEDLGLTEATVRTALMTLESEGFVLQGDFFDRSDGEEQWCERRLLARIHRMTLDGARRAVQPVSPHVYWQFLFDHHHATPNTRKSGIDGVRAVIEQLQGIQASAGAWEYDILPTRVSDYSPQHLDELSQSGEIAWGRLRPPVENDRNGRRARGNGMTRLVPLAVVLRSDLAWLLPEDRDDASDRVRGDAVTVFESLQQHGALFFQELQVLTGLLESQLQTALSELAFFGLVSADGFEGIRHLVAPTRSRGLRRRRPSRSKPTRQGRWSRFPFAALSVPAEQRIEQWARQLLYRYGVVCRDVVGYEDVAPPWSELVRFYRRLESKGEVRGGRFISGVAGEQYALGPCIDKLRKIRDQKPATQWQVVNAADPLNLTGLFSDHRVTGTRGNALAVRNGRLIADYQAGEISFHEDVQSVDREEISRALRTTAWQRQREIEFAASAT